jgi:hypothetical protein
MLRKLKITLYWLVVFTIIGFIDYNIYIEFKPEDSILSLGLLVLILMFICAVLFGCAIMLFMILYEGLFGE